MNECQVTYTPSPQESENIRAFIDRMHAMEAKAEAKKKRQMQARPKKVVTKAERKLIKARRKQKCR